MLKIGICDDDPTFVDDIEKNIEQTIKKHHWNGKIVVQLALLMLDEIVICVFITEIKGCLVGIIRKNSIAIFIAQHDKKWYGFVQRFEAVHMWRRIIRVPVYI